MFASETEISFEPSQVYRPDVAGWRRENLPELTREVPITVRPDWVCEILSASNAHNDLVKKMRIDPEAETLTVYRWMAEGYLLVQTATGRELVRAEPFGEVELSVRGLIEGDE